jgi:hypothetical protein
VPLPVSSVLDNAPAVLRDFRIYEGGQVLSELSPKSKSRSGRKAA